MIIICPLFENWLWARSFRDRLYLSPITNSLQVSNYYPHFTYQETKDPRDELTYTQMHWWKVGEIKLKLRTFLSQSRRSFHRPYAWAQIQKRRSLLLSKTHSSSLSWRTLSCPPCHPSYSPCLLSPSPFAPTQPSATLPKFDNPSCTRYSRNHSISPGLYFICLLKMTEVVYTPWLLNPDLVPSNSFSWF